HQQKNFEKELKMNSFFVKTCQDFSKTDTFIGNKGNLIATNCKANFDSVCYTGQSEAPKHILHECNPNQVNRCLIHAAFDCQDKRFNVATTHFTWSANGKTSDLQKNDLKKLKQKLDKIDQFILCGDFNNPRGEYIYDSLASWYSDNIPQEVKTTIDPDLHRAGPLQLVVDGLFSTDSYQANSVKIVSGLSDHQAVVAKFGLNLN
ncbi:MAG: hypothetical protein U9O78_04515, partial [Patescibacteria group bacterium]|nr:hypothetical protein [Patescibacteria group bacterium]